MSKEKRRVPKLRFPGFTEDWEQRKVNDIFKITRGQVLATLLTTPKKTSQNIYPVYSSQTKNNGLMGYYSEYLFENAITWTTDGANAGTVNFRPGRFYSTNVNGVLINENGYACYAVSEIINKVAYKYVSKVGNPKLMNNVMSEINIMITPDIDELEQISKLIEAYNQYITLHQRKLEHLNLKKKALLQKLFPKNGERYPELRFPGFTDAWEQRKLGSIGSTYTGLSGKAKEDFGHGEAQYITYLNVFLNTVSDITMTDKVEIDTTQNEVKYGDVLFTTSSETPEEVGMSSVWMGDSPNTYLNSFCFGFRPNQKINPYFLGYSLRAPYMRDKIKILAQGISRYNISKNKVMELEISLPNNEEQKLLGTFLQRIDLIITLHQRKLEHLQLQKKALLQQMFV